MTSEDKPETVTVYVSIGNSDDKLGQHSWAAYASDFAEAVQQYAEQVHGEFYSSPHAPYQNACIAAEVPTVLVDNLRDALTSVRAEYGQDSIAWAVAPETEFI